MLKMGELFLLIALFHCLLSSGLSPVGPYLTPGIEGGITGLSSPNLTSLLITCQISLLAPSRVLS